MYLLKRHEFHMSSYLFVTQKVYYFYKKWAEFVCMYICVYSMCVCVYICIYTHIYIIYKYFFKEKLDV